MKKKNVKLEYYVIRVDSNTNQIKRYNIFYNGFIDELSKRMKRDNIDNKDKLKDYLKRWAMYNYWSKCECEILVGSLFKYKEEDLEKIDIWYQIEKNLDMITDYVINKCQIKFDK